MNLNKPVTLFLLAAALFFLNVKADAQTKVDCANPKTQLEINICAENTYDSADKELNVLYKKVSAKLSGPAKQTLLQSQRKWIAFRDEYASIYGMLYEGGSAAAAAMLDCKTTATRTRIAELKTLLEQTEL